jgi:hypothetical protein
MRRDTNLQIGLTVTRGHKSSERKACYHAFLAGLILAGAGIHYKADLNALGILIGSVTLPLMWYAGVRTAGKIKNGETTE